MSVVLESLQAKLDGRKSVVLENEVTTGTKTVSQMLSDKLYASQNKYNRVLEEIEGMDIGDVILKRQVIERRIEGLYGEYTKQLENLQDSLTIEVEQKLEKCTNRLQKDVLISGKPTFHKQLY